jgi:hypothetical protein
VGFFAIGIEDPLDVAVQRIHDSDARQHRVTASRHEQQNLDRGLPFRQPEFLLRQLRDVVGCVLERDELATVRQRYRILKLRCQPVSAIRRTDRRRPP